MKRRLGVIAAVAVLAALTPALSTSVASAAPATTPTAAADVTTLSACPTNASIPSAGFTDTTSTDVDCIKYYGITTGVTATTYEPDSSVPRWQMALFLTRAATEMGVTLGDGSDQDFTDISGESAAIQTAINQIKQLGVTTGTTATTYDPASNVTKEQMSMFVRRLLENVTPGPNGSNDDDSDGDSAVETYVNGATATYNYSDIDTGDTTYEGHNSIVEVFNLGVTGDAKTVTTFSPSSDLTRAQMATWLTNAAAHSNLRPAGLHIQSTDAADYGAMTAATDEIHVSNRDANFDAIGSALVDVFCFDNATVVALTAQWNDVAFTAAGLISGADKTSAGSTAGTVESSDDITDATGNVKIEQSSMSANCDAAESANVDYYAHTGAVGDIFDKDTTTYSTTNVTSTAAADYLRWSTSLPLATAVGVAETVVTNVSTIPHHSSYGTDTVVTFQLASAETVATYPVARAGCYIQVTEYTSAAVIATSTVDTYAAAATAITTHLLVTDAAGQATFTMSSADPSTAVDNGARGQVLQIANPAVYNTVAECATSWTDTNNINTGALVSDTDFALKWDDTARDEQGVAITLADGYVLASATGTGATNTVTALSYDQYGSGIAANSLGMTLTGTGDDAGEAVGQDDEGGTAITNTFTTTRTTNASGVATWGVSRDSAVSGRTTFRVNDSEDNNDVETMYWTNLSSATAVGDDATNSVPNTLLADTDYASVTSSGEVGAQLVGLDTANDILVVEITTDTAASGDTRYVQYSYDSNDQYTVNGAAQDIIGFEYFMGLLGSTVGADTRYLVQTPLDDTTVITIKAASLVSVFTIDTVL